MIDIRNINISFDKEIIVSSNMKIENGKITVITGESGSGKTTLLYILGLISSQKGYKYSINQEVIDCESDYFKSKIRKRKIGYIFQDNNLNNQLTILDNIKTSARISGYKMSTNEVAELIEYVNVSR